MSEYDTECVQCCGYQDRIAELEAALEKITGKAMIVQAWEIARAALEDKDDKESLS